ncbi:MAG: RNHCP domain-containing protein [Rickettsiales bacterium]|nr:MAG: RNHCP domain-containing protein [Rickettsiales bacterium]
MESKKFLKNIEDFSCEICSTFVKGNGYTNHCPSCFYSKHVDVNPGDRHSDCKGLMKPVSYETNTKKGVIITHQCTKCGVFKRNKIHNDDDIIQLIKSIQSINNK